MIAERLRVYSQAVVLLLSVAFILLGFLAGSIPFGLLVAKRFGMDIRTAGSGNIGMTNVWRVLGWKPGLAVLILDVLKGYLPVVIANWLLMPVFWTGGDGWRVLSDRWPDSSWIHPFGRMLENQGQGYGDNLSIWLGCIAPMLVGLAAVLGHTFTPWLKFKGGKGVATGLGVAVALYGWWILIPVGVFVVLLLVSRMVSLSSLIAALVLAFVGFVAAPAHSSLNYVRLGQWRMWPFGILACLLVVYTHRSNIKRILNGTENKVSFGRKRAAGA